MTPAMEIPKVATSGQRNRNGGEVKVFEVPHLWTNFSKILQFFFTLLHPNMQKTMSYCAGKADICIPCNFGR